MQVGMVAYQRDNKQGLQPVAAADLDAWCCCRVNSGLLTTAFEENPRLKSFFKVLALSLDNKGLPYISLMEARQVSGVFREMCLVDQLLVCALHLCLCLMGDELSVSAWGLC